MRGSGDCPVLCPQVKVQIDLFLLIICSDSVWFIADFVLIKPEVDSPQFNKRSKVLLLLRDCVFDLSGLLNNLVNATMLLEKSSDLIYFCSQLLTGGQCRALTWFTDYFLLWGQIDLVLLGGEERIPSHLGVSM